ncbi:hypothetical protein ACET3Z_027076 [Daucus carota]
MNVTYRVLNIDQTTQVMKIAREDVMNVTCPQELVNTTFNYAVYDFTSAYMNITFLYGCPVSVKLQSPSTFSCGSKEYDSVNVVSGAHGPGNCKYSVVVPVLKAGAEGSVSLTHLDQLLQEGFEVRWKMDGKACSDCTSTGGRCGYSFSTNQTTCFCPGQSYLSDSCSAANRASPGPGHLPASYCQVYREFNDCGKRFRCGNFSNLDYPFWGGDRQSYCGHPAFQLNCQENVTFINLRSKQYRVLGVDTRSQVITVAREDLWNNTCPSPINNTDLDYTLFSHPSDDQNLTLSYGCASIPGQQLPYEFDCTVNGVSSDSYFTTQTAASLAPNIAQLTCNTRITVPINQTSADALSNIRSSENDLKEVLKAGFRLKWDANDSICNECARPGGRCGYNSSTSSFACYCSDRECNLIDSSNDRQKAHTNKSQTKTARHVIIRKTRWAPH